MKKPNAGTRPVVCTIRVPHVPSCPPTTRVRNVPSCPPRGWPGQGVGVGMLRVFFVSWFQRFLVSGCFGFLVFGFLVSKLLGLKVSMFRRFTKLPFHFCWRTLIPYPRVPRFSKRIDRCFRRPSIRTFSKVWMYMFLKILKYYDFKKCLIFRYILNCPGGLER